MANCECKCGFCPLLSDESCELSKSKVYSILKPECGFLIENSICGLLLQSTPILGSFSHKEISEAMEIPIRKIKYIEAQALKKLKIRLVGELGHL